jgi:hypothetical protein
MPIVFDPLELHEPAEPAARDVMCAFCGTVTSRPRLLASGAAN